MFGIGLKGAAIGVVAIILIAALVFFTIPVDGGGGGMLNTATIIIEDESTGQEWQATVDLSTPTVAEQMMMSIGGGIRETAFQPLALYSGTLSAKISETGIYHVRMVATGKLVLTDMKNLNTVSGTFTGYKGTAQFQSQSADYNIIVADPTCTNYVPTSNPVTKTWTLDMATQAKYWNSCVGGGDSGGAISGAVVNGMRLCVAVDAFGIDSQNQVRNAPQAFADITISANFLAGTLSLSIDSLSSGSVTVGPY